ncbi:uncharacterized protein CMU_035350 [Cryptosporidium muris RN66]|uniref:Uncharacterized protein n=1 Tax=Cryptosporidium muris (strain RN66) TaxID=441375 RepID=B6AGM2_CRYMR|nr:uncharacterized protein CMU_035350 [Cryptosporidium muris RN66]EEA07363.1 hypothetical protein CMU_035350 [Cryptosporidium muris RN66]|eukprot:XP_002141712.1 hypothetical protein [Cryptosporidium muris RN66]
MKKASRIFLFWLFILYCINIIQCENFNQSKCLDPPFESLEIPGIGSAQIHKGHRLIPILIENDLQICYNALINLNNQIWDESEGLLTDIESFILSTNPHSNVQDPNLGVNFPSIDQTPSKLKNQYINFDNMHNSIIIPSPSKTPTKVKEFHESSSLQSISLKTQSEPIYLGEDTRINWFITFTEILLENYGIPINIDRTKFYTDSIRKLFREFWFLEKVPSISELPIEIWDTIVMNGILELLSKWRTIEEKKSIIKEAWQGFLNMEYIINEQLNGTLDLSYYKYYSVLSSDTIKQNIIPYVDKYLAEIEASRKITEQKILYSDSSYKEFINTDTNLAKSSINKSLNEINSTNIQIEQGKKDIPEIITPSENFSDSIIPDKKELIRLRIRWFKLFAIEYMGRLGINLYFEDNTLEDPIIIEFFGKVWTLSDKIPLVLWKLLNENGFKEKLPNNMTILEKEKIASNLWESFINMEFSIYGKSGNLDLYVGKEEMLNIEIREIIQVFLQQDISFTPDMALKIAHNKLKIIDGIETPFNPEDLPESNEVSQNIPNTYTLRHEQSPVSLEDSVESTKNDNNEERDDVLLDNSLIDEEFAKKPDVNNVVSLPSYEDLFLSTKKSQEQSLENKFDSASEKLNSPINIIPDISPTKNIDFAQLITEKSPFREHEILTYSNKPELSMELSGGYKEETYTNNDNILKRPLEGVNIGIYNSEYPQDLTHPLRPNKKIITDYSTNTAFIPEKKESTSSVFSENIIGTPKEQLSEFSESPQYKIIERLNTTKNKFPQKTNEVFHDSFMKSEIPVKLSDIPLEHLNNIVEDNWDLKYPIESRESLYKGIVNERFMENSDNKHIKKDLEQDEVGKSLQVPIISLQNQDIDISHTPTEDMKLEESSYNEVGKSFIENWDNSGYIQKDLEENKLDKSSQIPMKSSGIQNIDISHISSPENSNLVLEKFLHTSFPEPSEVSQSPSTIYELEPEPIDYKDLLYINFAKFIRCYIETYANIRKKYLKPIYIEQTKEILVNLFHFYSESTIIDQTDLEKAIREISSVSGNGGTLTAIRYLGLTIKQISNSLVNYINTYFPADDTVKKSIQDHSDITLKWLEQYFKSNVLIYDMLPYRLIEEVQNNPIDTSIVPLKVQRDIDLLASNICQKTKEILKDIKKIKNLDDSEINCKAVANVVVQHQMDLSKAIYLFLLPLNSEYQKILTPEVAYKLSLKLTE